MRGCEKCRGTNKESSEENIPFFLLFFPATAYVQTSALNLVELTIP